MSQKFAAVYDEKGERVSGISIDIETGILYYLKKHNGKLIKFSLQRGRDQLNAAKRFANLELPKHLGKTKRRSAISHNGEMLDNFFEFKKTQGLDESTLERIETTIRLKIKPYWGSYLISEIDDENVADWVRWFKTSFPGETMDNAVKYLRVYQNFLLNRGLITRKASIQDPDKKKVLIARSEKTERVFTSEEKLKVFQTAANHRERLVVRIMATMATRIEETLTLRFNREIRLDIDPPKYRWSLGQNKADHEGEHILHPSIVDDIRALKLSNKSEYLFPQARNPEKPMVAQNIDFNEWRKRANLGWHWSSKTFRHTLLTELFNNPRLPQMSICKQYRISPEVAFRTYVKTTDETMRILTEAVQ